MPQIKQNSTPLVKVRLLSSIDGIQGVTGQSGATCTLAITRSDGSVNTYAASAFTLTEITSGAFANAGYYWLTLPAYGSAILGAVVYCVVVSTGSARVFMGTLEVVANLVSDVMTQLGTPVASVSADIAAIKTELDTVNTSVGSGLGTNVTAIKAKTDNLPSDPASQATTLSEIGSATSPLATSAALTTLQTSATAIKAKTDNLPSDPADESLLEAAITAAASPLATSSALTTVGGNVTAIKAKTDNLPAAPASTSDVTTATSGLATASALAAVKSDTGSILKINTGRWKLVSNQLLIYDTDNTTVLYTFNLKDAGGVATMLNPYERVPA